MKGAGPTREGTWGELDGRSDVFDETVAGTEAPAQTRVSYAPGTRIGRYVILSEIGSGGMGVVYAAFDYELNRKIALKILTPKKAKVRVRSADQAAGRLMREAQAIARLSHPNVVNVYDVGRHGEAVFVAMEFIEGLTLTRWLEQEERSLREICKVFADAGQGLLAAHEAGLVHRDFKPDNVLVSADGRVRVLDFGLARADPTHSSQFSHVSHVSHVSNSLDGEEPEDELDGVPQSRDLGESDVLSSPLTLDDAVVGTPRYMAPEQHAGVGVDARSDQFSFCVAFYQALYHQDPFPADRLRDLVRLKQQGQIAPLPSDVRVPSWLEELVLRGLLPRPADRWPSMREVVDRLEQDPEAKRRRGLLMGGGAIVLVMMAALTGQQLSQKERPCQDGARHLQGLWDEPRREAIRQAIVGTELAYADHTWSEVERRVDRDLERWVDTYRDTCEATRVRGEQSDELLDLRMSCLQDHLSEVRAVLDVLSEPDVAVVQRAVSMVSGLPGFEGCADAEQLRTRLPPPQDEATKQRVEQLRQSLRDARARQVVQPMHEIRAQVQEVLAEAETLGYEPLRIEALFSLGAALEHEGDYAGAETRLRESLWAALRAQHDRVAAQACIQLVSVVGDRLARYDEGLTWAEQAAALLDRTGAQGAGRIGLLNNEGNVWHRKGDNEKALALYQEVVSRREQAGEAESPSTAVERINLGNAQVALGQFDAALVSYREAEASLRRTLGEGHPQIATAVASIGHVYSASGRYTESLVQFRRALPDFEAWLGSEHLFVATTLMNIGIAERELGQLDEAEAVLRRAQGIYEKKLGADHPQVAACLSNLAEVRIEQQRYDEAERLFQRALELGLHRLGEGHEAVVGSRLSLASLGRRRGEAPRAVGTIEGLATQAEKDKLDEVLRGAIHFELAKARWDAGQAAERARADLERARAFLRQGGGRGLEALRELDAWDREHARDDRPRLPDGSIAPSGDDRELGEGVEPATSPAPAGQRRRAPKP
ncbi:serine/threonine-protein kinase [Paraliomyxa miuraensis]|uniref:serine/threonine-protein kinase n=1 Tax=Paraliomyxa miuraensis TaxID=376150 RepID=UPI00225C1557|nr:tetratricopeptide repeat protein [Paraliomyxa miuraensis]MCX4239289.1 tetratricopeptide repeat protein [Paraliomyxa miuraensis]